MPLLRHDWSVQVGSITSQCSPLVPREVGKGQRFYILFMGPVELRITPILDLYFMFFMLQKYNLIWNIEFLSSIKGLEVKKKNHAGNID